jgi:hypothetical protein
VKARGEEEGRKDGRYDVGTAVRLIKVWVRHTDCYPNPGRRWAWLEYPKLQWDASGLQAPQAGEGRDVYEEWPGLLRRNIALE